jgi:hypothetical protein
MHLRARGHARLAHQQRAEILKTDRVGQQHEEQRTESDRRLSSLSMPTRNRHDPAHATQQYLRRACPKTFSVSRNHAHAAHAGGLPAMLPIILWAD